MGVQVTGNRPRDFKPVNYGNRFEKAIDTVVGLIHPASRLSRMDARRKIYETLDKKELGKKEDGNQEQMGYATARSTRERDPAPPIQGPDNPIHQYDSVSMIRRAEELARDSPIMNKIIDVYRSYVVGSIEYVPNTGDGDRDEVYQNWWNDWTKQSDVTGRFHFIDQIQHAHGGVMIQGRHGLAHHHFDDGTFCVQNVEGECVGNPKAIRLNPGQIRGVVINAGGGIDGYEIFRRSLYDQFHFDRFIPSYLFSYLNPVKRSDSYNAVTPFHAVLNEDFDVKDVIRAEKMALKWASRKIATVNTTSGSAPSLDNTGTGKSGSIRSRMQEFEMGEVLYGDSGMKVDMITNDRPNENVMKFLEFLIDLYTTGVDLPSPFVWVKMGLPGTYTRLISEQAKRTFQDGRLGQRWLQRSCLDEIKRKAFTSGIIMGKIPWCKTAMRGQFLFPAHPTVDVGRESEANLNEIRMGVTSMAEVCGEKGLYWKHVDQQIGLEAANKVEIGQRVANEFNAKHQNDLNFIPMTRQEAMGYVAMMTPNMQNPNAGGGTTDGPSEIHGS